MDNHEYCAKFVLENLPSAERVLDYGCGAGEIVQKLRAAGINAFGCDVFYEAGNRSKLVPAEFLGSVILQMHDQGIPFPDAYFDAVISNQVFEHVPDLHTVLTEIRRVLKPGGLLLSLFPDKRVLREGHSGIPLLHWFPKQSRFRIFYAAFLRLLGFGYFKQDKGVLEWSKGFCRYLDEWTFYRSFEEINSVFSEYFSPPLHRETHWLNARLGKRAWLARWVPRIFQNFLVRRFCGLIFLCKVKHDTLPLDLNNQYR